MHPIDTFDPSILTPDHAASILSPDDYRAFLTMQPSEREARLHELLTAPIAVFTPINELYFRSKWASLIGHFHGNSPLTLLEVASGDADMIPQTLSRTNPTSRYLTANMNVKLNESLLRKTADLNIDLRLIDDDAANIKQYVREGAVDMVAFQHGANDVIQAILCSKQGIDTTYSDWMATLPKMIEFLQHETKAGTLEDNVKLPFLALLTSLLDLLKPCGIIAIHHYMFQLDLDWGYPPALFENITPMVRDWAKELSGCSEITIEGFDPQWWLLLQKN